MDIKEWAAKLNGIQYPANELEEENGNLKSDGIIAVYGASDDLMEFRGAIYDEVGAWEGATAKIAPGENGKLKIFNEEENKETAEFNKKQIAAMQKIKAIWEPVDEEGKIFASWLIETKIPHETFDIMEDGELFCRGIVFNVEGFEAARK
jgi:chloramphenicol O-acetyltransferase